MIRIGTDLVSVSRIDKARKRFGDRFVKRYLSPDEVGPDMAAASLAGRWAAKEAIAKALGCGIGGELSFHDIRIEKDARGAPSFTLSPKVLRRFPIRQSSLSISHDGGFAIAVVIIVLGDHSS
ncbi:holo-ACP synthase [Nitratifractor sp.]